MNRSTRLRWGNTIFSWHSPHGRVYTLQSRVGLLQETNRYIHESRHFNSFKTFLHRRLSSDAAELLVLSTLYSRETLPGPSPPRTATQMQQNDRTFQFISDPTHKENLSGRVTAACLNCRRKKIRCSGEAQCRQCAEKGIHCDVSPDRIYVCCSC